MKAAVGDRIVIASNRLDGEVRDGKVIECKKPDGSPPYLVEWSDDGHTSLYFPGPDAHVQHLGGEAEAAPQPTRHVKRWRVDLDVFESAGETSAHAVLVAEAPGIEARGSAHVLPGYVNVPEIGDEVAVARALHRLADRLLGVARDDLTDVAGHPVHLER
jgi:Domain of unknown function (DUF1918)/Domain of unknown function (DUF1876)